MRVLKTLAVVGALVAGALGLGGSASATPLASGAMPAVQGQAGAVVPVGYYHRGRPYYGYRRVYHRPVYRAYRPYRPVYYRPYRRAYYRPVYRPYPRVVCRTVWRSHRTYYGRIVTRPVRTCFRRW
jgi:hypothetical protein